MIDESRWIATRTPEFRTLHDRIKVATQLSAKLSALCYDEPESIQEAFEELIGKPVGERFNLVPPFYSDYGLNVTVGQAVFIGYECAFTGHAAINIADGVMIAHRVNLVTAGHPVEPDKRKAYHRRADHHRHKCVDRSRGHDPVRCDDRRRLRGRRWCSGDA